MGVFNGNNLVLGIAADGSTPAKFAHSRSANISFSNSLIDSTTKDSNSWEEMISGRRSFSISTDGLVDFDDVTSATSTEGFSDLALPGSKVDFTFQRPSTGLSAGDFLGYSGEAYIESFDISTTSDDLVTYSVSLRGTGELVKVVAS